MIYWTVISNYIIPKYQNIILKINIYLNNYVDSGGLDNRGPTVFAFTRFCQIVNLYFTVFRFISQYGSSSSIGSYKTVNVISQAAFEKMAPKAPRKTNPEVPPPPPASSEEMEISQSLPAQVNFIFLLIFFRDFIFLWKFIFFMKKNNTISTYIYVYIFVNQLPSSVEEKRDRKADKARWREDRTRGGSRGRRGAVPRFFAVVKDEPAVDPRTPRKRKTRHSNNPPVEHHVGWIMDVREHRPRTYSTGWVWTRTFFTVKINSYDIWLL